MAPRRPQVFPLIYWVIVAGVFSFAAWRRFSLPLDPIADPDTWGYLSPALHQLTGGGFTHEGRNFLYPGFLWMLLRVFGDFRAITIAQHLLGLLAGVFLLLAWRRARLFVAEPRLPSGAQETFGLILVTICLLAGEPIRAEMQIRPEGVCAFVLSLNLFFAAVFIRGAFVEKRALVWQGIALVGTATVLASLKPSFVLVAFVAVLPVLLSFLRREFLSRKILAISSVTIALLLLAPEYILSRNDYIARMFLPTTLFVIHADLIRDQMEEDLRDDATLPYSRDFLSRVHGDLTEEIRKSAAAEPEYYLSLGFSPDYLMYRETSIAVRLAFEFEDNPDALVAFYRAYYWRIWRHRPLAVLRKIGRQMALFYTPICPAYDRSKFMPLTPAYQDGVSSLDGATYFEVWKRYPPAVEFMGRVQALAERAPLIEQRRVLRRTLTFTARAYLPLLAITMVVASVIMFRRDSRRRIGWLAALAVFVFCYNATACFEVAALHSLEIPRYSTVQFVFTLFAEFLACWLLLESFFGSWRPMRDQAG